MGHWGDQPTPLVETISHHSEFTFGLDLSSLEAGKVECFGEMDQFSFHVNIVRHYKGQFSIDNVQSGHFSVACSWL